MANPQASKQRIIPEAFHRRNRAESERVIELTQRAIALLEAVHQAVTLSAVAATTQSVDEKRKGLSAKTILRNADAATLFRAHSPVYQRRRQKVRRAKRKRTRVEADARATYRGLRTLDLIQMVEDLKKQNAELQAQRDKLQAERDEAYRLRGEAVELNTRQLAALTRQMQQNP